MATEPRYIIFDTDMGADDAWALQMLLIAEKKLKNVKVLAITCVDGNTTMENVIKNTYRILSGLNRTDISIHRGAIEPISLLDQQKSYTRGKNGMCDVDVWDSNFPEFDGIVHPTDATQIIRDIVMQYPKKVTIVGVGPLTNIALAAKIYPEIRQNVDELYIMGGKTKGTDFNFGYDPEAAHIVLNSYDCKKIIVPWDCCKLKENIDISTDWFFNVLGKLNGPNMDFLMKVESIYYENLERFFPCDAFLTAVLLFPDCIRKRFNCHATVELSGRESRGRIFIDCQGKKPSNVTVIECLYDEPLKKAFIFTADADSS